MICALTVRKLKPGAFDDFRAAFTADFPEEPPENWVRFNMVRNTADPDEVITFGFFEGSVEDLRAQMSEMGRSDQQERIAPFVESTGADGLYEIVEDRSMSAA